MQASLDENYRTAKTVWASPTTLKAFSGDGGVANPYRLPGGNLDLLIPYFGGSVTVRLAEGEYVTRGFRCPKEFVLVGAGIGKTVVKLASDCNDNFNFPAVRMFSDNNWSDIFVLKGVTLDGNWDGQSIAPVHGNYKIEPVSVQCICGRVEEVEVVNFGANGKDYGDQGFEAFPLSLITFSNGEPYSYFPTMSALVRKEKTTFAEILNCKVRLPHFLNGGYCTAVFVRTNMTKQGGDRQDFGVRSAPAARIAGNFVEAPGGIAYGAAYAEMCAFENNMAVNSKCGFNADTGQCGRIRILRNQFLGVSQGINFTPSPGSQDIAFDRNVFVLGEPFFNPVLKSEEESYCIRAMNLAKASASSNWCVASSPRSKFLTGVDGADNAFLNVGGTASKEDIRRLANRIALLEGGVRDCRYSLDAAAQKLRELMP